MEFGILGTTEVTDGDRVVDLPARRGRALLVLLVLHAGEVVSAERLIDELWGEAPPATAGTVVQGLVSKLRSLLEPGRRKGEPGSILETDPRFALMSALTTQSDPSPDAMPIGLAPTSMVASTWACWGPVGPVEAVGPVGAVTSRSTAASRSPHAAKTRRPASASAVRRGAPLSIAIPYVLRRSPRRARALLGRKPQPQATQRGLSLPR